MKIEIICIGSLKKPYLREAESDYLKRLAPYCKIRVTELREAKLPKNAGRAEEETVRAREGEALLVAAEKQSSATFLIALDMRGKQQSSEIFAETLERFSIEGKGSLVFLIGGSLGLSDTVRKKADDLLSLSDMTFPHQLTRIILLEQLYRAHKISRGEVYHK